MSSSNVQRKQAILVAASRQFGQFGFRGTSLRDIASEAGVSLTLLRHHFGAKSDLLVAVVEAHRPWFDERVALLRRLKRTASGSLTTHDLVEAWIRNGFELAARDDGTTFIRLLARVIDAPTDEDALPVRDRSNDAALEFIEALHLCPPAATKRAVAATSVWINASLLMFLEGARQIFSLTDSASSPSLTDDDQARMVRFLVAGAEAALSDSAVDPVRGSAATSAIGNADSLYRRRRSDRAHGQPAMAVYRDSATR